MKKGIITALITPFNEDKIDWASLEKLLISQEESSVNGLLLCGTTGEAPSLTLEERIELIKFSKKTTKLPLLAGSGTNSLSQTLKYSKESINAGADALLIVTPYYNKPTPAGLLKYFTKIADELKFPIMMYNIPSRTGIDMPTDIIVELSEHPSIIGIKESSGSIQKVVDIFNRRKRDDFVILSGDDPIFLPSMIGGADGVISVASNIIPDLMVKIYNLWQESNIKEASKLYRKLVPFFNSLFIETNPGPIKAALYQKGKIAPFIRLPLVWPKEETIIKVKKELDKI